jgi:hypothetical protein
MKRLTCLLGVILWAGAALAEEPLPTFEPVSALFYLDLSELNGLLEQNGFPKIASAIALAGSWTRVRALDWLPLGLSIAEGSVGAERGERRVSFNLFLFQRVRRSSLGALGANPRAAGFCERWSRRGHGDVTLGSSRYSRRQARKYLTDGARHALAKDLLLSDFPRGDRVCAHRRDHSEGVGGVYLGTVVWGVGAFF